MTIKEFRQNQVLVDWWRKAFYKKEFQVLWQMLQDMHPMRFTDGTAITSSSAENKLGNIQGYELLLERLRLCTTMDEIMELPDPTFRPVDQLEQEA